MTISGDFPRLIPDQMGPESFTTSDTPVVNSAEKIEVFEGEQLLAYKYQTMKRYPLLPEKYLCDDRVRKALTEAIDNPRATTVVFRGSPTSERTSFIVRQFDKSRLIFKLGTEAEIAEAHKRGVHNCDEVGETYEVAYEATTLSAMVREFNRATTRQLLADLEKLGKPKSNTMNKFEQTQVHLKTSGGYAARGSWGGNRKIYYFSPVAHGVETVSPDGQSMPLAPFYAERVGDGPLTPYFPSDEDFNATDWQIFRKTYVQHL